MLFCPKCSVELDDDDNYCSKCGYKLKAKDKEARITKVISTLDELVTKSSKKDLTRANRIMGIVIIALIITVLFLVLVVTGAVDDAFRGSGLGFLDPCEREYKECNRECGEGLIGGLCKDGCTIRYRQCRG